MSVSRAVNMITHRPLYGKETEEESNASVPPTGLIDNASSSEYIVCGVHVRSGSLRQENDNDYLEMMSI